MTTMKDDREIKINVPAGMDPSVGAMLFQQLFSDLHDMEPLAHIEAKEIVSQGLLNDMPKLAQFRRRITEAPEGSMWGVEIAEAPSVLMPGSNRRGITINAMCRMREAKANGDMNLIIGTLTCFALLTSAPARGLLAMHNVGMKVIPPYMPSDESDDGAEG